MDAEHTSFSLNLCEAIFGRLCDAVGGIMAAPRWSHASMLCPREGLLTADLATLLTQQIGSDRRISQCLDGWSMMKELEANNELHKNDDLCTQNANGAWRLRSTLLARLLDIRRPRFQEHLETLHKAERILGPTSYTDSFARRKNLVTQLFPAPQPSSRAPSPKK